MYILVHSIVGMSCHDMPTRNIQLKTKETAETQSYHQGANTMGTPADVCRTQGTLKLMSSQNWLIGDFNFQSNQNTIIKLGWASKKGVENNIFVTRQTITKWRPYTTIEIKAMDFHSVIHFCQSMSYSKNQWFEPSGGCLPRKPPVDSFSPLKKVNRYIIVWDHNVGLSKNTVPQTWNLIIIFFMNIVKPPGSCDAGTAGTSTTRGPHQQARRQLCGLKSLVKR